MKKSSNIKAPFIIAGALSVLACVIVGVIAVTAPQEVTPTQQEAPSSESHKKQASTIENLTPFTVEDNFNGQEGWDKVETIADFKTGWVQKDDGIELSLAGAENCVLEPERVLHQDGFVTVELKEERTEGCVEGTHTVAYYNIPGTGEVQQVEIIPFGEEVGYLTYKLD